jgi:PAS domain S-box-containing protein
VAVCAAYSFTIMGDWVVDGMDNMALNVYANLGLLGFCGWIMHQLGKVLRQTEADAARRARELLSSESTLRTILDNTAEPIVVYGENEFVAEANRQACAFLGVPRDSLVGRRFREFLFDDGLLSDRMDAARRAGEFHDEMLVVRPDGNERSVDMHIHSFIRDRRRFFVAMFRDITEQKDLQDAQRQAKGQLEAANRELQRVNTLRDDFYSTVARRLRSPLSAILGFIDMLLDEEMGELGSEQRGALQSCRRSARRVLDMVDDAFETAPPPEPQETPAVPVMDAPARDNTGDSV